VPLLVERQALPLLALSYVDAYTDSELVQFLVDLEAVLQEPGQKACLIDLRRAQPGSAKQRQMQGQWISDNEAVLQRDFVATALVADSAIIRGTITAVFWIRPLPMPSQVVATVEAAMAWLEPYLAELERPARPSHRR
jgi:hypothetical protein